MKILNYLVLGTAALTLAACNSSSSSKGTGVAVNPYQITNVINPTEKPANAAPAAYVNAFLEKNAAAKGIIPSSTAIFKRNFDDRTDAELDAQDYKKDFDILSVEGKENLQKILSQCTLENPAPVKNGELAAGATTTIELRRAASGAACPALQEEKSKNVISASVFTEVDQVISLESTSETSLKIQDAKMAASSGVSQSNITSKSTVQAEMHGAGANLKAKSKSMSAGTMRIVTSENEVIEGPVSQEEFSIMDGSPESQSKGQYVINLNSPAGAIRIVLMMDSKASPTHQYYINGEPTDAKNVVSFFGKEVTSAE